VRLKVGDTDTSDQQLTDAEIEFALDEASDDPAMAAAQCCRWLIAKYSRQVDHANMSLRVSASQRVSQYQKLLEELEDKALTETVAPWAGGLSIAGKDTEELDTDRVDPGFTRRLDKLEGST